jgi:hypothetical protein
LPTALQGNAAGGNLLKASMQTAIIRASIAAYLTGSWTFFACEQMKGL